MCVWRLTGREAAEKKAAQERYAKMHAQGGSPIPRSASERVLLLTAQAKRLRPRRTWRGCKRSDDDERPPLLSARPRRQVSRPWVQPCVRRLTVRGGKGGRGEEGKGDGQEGIKGQRQTAILNMPVINLIELHAFSFRRRTSLCIVYESASMQLCEQAECLQADAR